MSAAKILDRLQRVKQTRPGQWKSACPCCESRKGQPLAIMEKDDGRVLIHAFCGCGTEDVLGRIGLTINDLFPAPLAHHAPPTHTRIPAGEVLASLSHEATMLALIASNFLNQRELNETEWERLATAARRIGHAADYVNERTK